MVGKSPLVGNLVTGKILVLNDSDLAFMEIWQAESQKMSKLQFATSDVGDTSNSWKKVSSSNETNIKHSTW